MCHGSKQAMHRSSQGTGLELSMASVAQTGQQLVVTFGRPAVALEGRDAETCQALAALLSEALRSKFLGLLAEDTEQAVLLVDSCDGTPVTTRRRITKKSADLDIVRSQRLTAEWLIVRKFLLTESGKRAVVFPQPRRMATKTSWAHFSACRETMPTGRELGHTGILVQHSVLDRPLRSFCSRLFAQIAQLAHDQVTSSMGVGRAWLLDQMTWHTSAGCALHDFHNGFKKGMGDYINERGFSATMFGVVASLRDCYAHLVGGIADWLPRVIVFDDWDDMPMQDQYELWVLLGLEPTLVEKLQLLQMRFSGGRLRIASAMREHPESAQLITTCLVAVWEFRQWTDSRWITMGFSGRRMTAALILGMDSLVATLREQKLLSEYYSKAYTNITDRHRLSRVGLQTCVSIKSGLRVRGHARLAVLLSSVLVCLPHHVAHL